MDWYDDYHKRKEEQQRRVNLAVAREQQLDHDRARRIFNVAAVTKLPRQIVDADLDNLELQLKKKQFNYDDYTDEKNGAPVFNKFATENPYNYAVLERDRKHMTRLERAAHAIDLGWSSGWGTIEMSEIVDRQMKGDFQEGDEERLEELTKLVAGGDFGAKSKFTKVLVETAIQLPIQGWLVKESADDMVGMAAAYATGTFLAGQFGPQAAAPEEILTVPSMALMGARHGFVVGRTEAAFRLERALAYKEYRDLGLNDSESRIAANIVGTVNAGLESIGLGALTKRIPGFDKIMKDRSGKILGEIFNQPTFRQGLARATLMYGEGVATEIATEVLQESMTMAGQEILKSRARAAGDDRPELAAASLNEWKGMWKEIAARTMYGTALIGGIGPLNQLRKDSARARAAREQQTMWSALGESASSVEIRETASEAWLEFVSLIQKDGPLDEVRFSAPGWRQYWQSRKIDPETAAEELGIDISELEFDSDIVMDFSTFLDKVAPTEHLAGLKEHLRVREDEFTFAEAKEWTAKAEEHVATLEKALEEQFGLALDEEIYEDAKGELLGSYNEKAADVQAKITSLIFTRLATEAGVKPMDLYQQRFGGVQREVPESLQKGDFDADVDPILNSLREGRFPRQRDIFSGGTLIDMIRDVGGIMDEGGELDSRDFVKQFPGVMSKTGKSFDGIAEIAAERGFIQDYDQTQLLEAIDRELAGEQVFSRYADVDTMMQTTLRMMEEAQEFLEQEGIDIQVMSNQEIRERLQGVNRYEQMDLDALEQLRTTLATVSETDPSLLTEIMRQLPRINPQQDFSSVEIAVKFVDKRGKSGTATVNAQDAFDNAVEERNILNRLLDCVRG